MKYILIFKRQVEVFDIEENYLLLFDFKSKEEIHVLDYF